MATSDDLLRFDARIKPLSRTIYTAVQKADGGRNSWVAVTLDARFSPEDESVIHKIRIEQVDGGVTGLTLPTEAAYDLIALGESRPQGQDRWYGLLIRITADGDCQANLNYDPKCADDESFWDS